MTEPHTHGVRDAYGIDLGTKEPEVVTFGHLVYGHIARERLNAHEKHGPNSMESRPVRSYYRYTILTEEVGEVAKEFNEAEARGGLDTLDLKKLHKELIQTAAMAAAWADAISREIDNG